MENEAEIAASSVHFLLISIQSHYLNIQSMCILKLILQLFTFVYSLPWTQKHYIIHNLQSMHDRPINISLQRVESWPTDSECTEKTHFCWRWKQVSCMCAKQNVSCHSWNTYMLLTIKVWCIMYHSSLVQDNVVQ